MEPGEWEMAMTEAGTLGRIERRDIREAWAHEAADFTPWLAEHLSEFGEALGMDLELQSQEAPVGTFSLDLLARVAGTNRTVIVENQLEPTDHDHMGKFLVFQPRRTGSGRGLHGRGAGREQAPARPTLGAKVGHRGRTWRDARLAAAGSSTGEPHRD